MISISPLSPLLLVHVPGLVPLARNPLFQKYSAPDPPSTPGPPIFMELCDLCSPYIDTKTEDYHFPSAWRIHSTLPRPVPLRLKLREVFRLAKAVYGLTRWVPRSYNSKIGP